MARPEPAQPAGPTPPTPPAESAERRAFRDHAARAEARRIADSEQPIDDPQPDGMTRAERRQAARLGRRRPR